MGLLSQHTNGKQPAERGRPVGSGRASEIFTCVREYGVPGVNIETMAWLLDQAGTERMSDFRTRVTAHQ